MHIPRADFGSGDVHNQYIKIVFWEIITTIIVIL